MVAPNYFHQTINLHIFVIVNNTQTKYHARLSTGIIYCFPKIFLKLPKQSILLILFFIQRTTNKNNKPMTFSQAYYKDRLAFVADIFFFLLFLVCRILSKRRDGNCIELENRMMYGRRGNKMQLTRIHNDGIFF